MEFFIALVHFLAVASPFLILCCIAGIGRMQPLELVSKGHRDLARPRAQVWDALADEPRLRLWAGETNGSSAFAVELGEEGISLKRGSANGSYLETWTITVEPLANATRISISQAVYARSALYRGAMRLFFPPAADYEKLLTAVENHVGAGGDAQNGTERGISGT